MTFTGQYGKQAEIFRLEFLFMRRVTAKTFITSGVSCFLLATALPALAAFTVPKHDGYVTDGANVLSESAEQSLEALATELDEKTTAQMAVLTVPTLDGTPIETAALSVARQWGIGQKGKSNGLLILLAVNDRKVRTEIGYGLEGIITDGTSGQIRDTYMVPYFKKGNYEQGLLQGSNALAALIAKDAGVTREALYRALSEDGDPRLSTLLGVLKALGISLHAGKSADTEAA